jgi:hypothetical protein
MLLDTHRATKGMNNPLVKMCYNSSEEVSFGVKIPAKAGIQRVSDADRIALKASLRARVSPSLRPK